MKNSNASVVYVLYWEDMSRSYLYGSRLEKIGTNQILFENRLFPSGSVIYKWDSHQRYQVTRTNVSLPLLQGGCTYHLKADFECYPSDSVYVRIKIFDRYEELIETIHMRESQISFEYPKNAYAYTIELVNAGSERIRFRNIQLTRDSNAFVKGAFDVSDLLHYDEDSEKLTLLLTEPHNHIIRAIDEEILKAISNVIVIKTSVKYGHLYLDKTFIAQLSQRLSQAIQVYDIRHVQLVAYGPIGNLAAVCLSEYFKNLTCYVSGELSDLRDYQRILLQCEKFVDDKLLSFVRDGISPVRAIPYASSSFIPGNTSLCGNLIGGENRLYKLPFLSEKTMRERILDE